ncbi:MAG: hypothetical protein FJ112_01820 [Deltaproteobacteria bacterium]|nr:hypothetical protein [Deltaproteobacteria bacterium]
MSTLWIVGTPLDDEGKLSASAIECINSADLIIAESKKNGFRYLKQTEFKQSTPLFFLDPFRNEIHKEIQTTLRQIAKENKKVVLFSDTGMPILFDPGSEILKLARELKFTIRSIPNATSWGTACALCGWGPPFLILGFLSREIADRKKQLAQITNASHHTVLMDTPYRFEALIDHVTEVFGPKQEVFLAWELAKPQERLIWGTIQQIQREAEQNSLKKGEFILIIRGNSRVK